MRRSVLGPLVLSDDEREQLERWARRPKSSQALAFRCRIVLSYNALWFYAARGKRLLRADADAKTVTGISRSFLPGPWIYLTATLFAFWSPTLSIVLFALIAFFYMLESALFGRGAVNTSEGT